MSFQATEDVIEVEYIEDDNILAVYIEWAQRVQTSHMKRHTFSGIE